MNRGRSFLIVISLIVLISLLGCKQESVSTPLKFQLSEKSDSIFKAEGKDRKVIDSLYTAFSEGKTDTLRMEILNEAVKKLHPKKSLAINNEIISFCRSKGWEKEMYSAYLSKHFVYASTGLMDSVKYYYALIKKQAEQTKDPDLLFGNEIFYGMSYGRIRELQISDSILLNVLRSMVKNKCGNNRHIAFALYSLGKNKNVEFDNNLAVKYLSLSAEYATLTADHYLLCEIFFRLGECYLMESDLNNAIEAYGKASDFSRLSRNESVMASSKAAIGEIYIFKEDHKKAEQFLNESIELAQKIGYKYQIGYSKATLGAMYLDKKELEKSLKCFKESSEIYEVLGKKKHRFELLRNDLCIGEVLLAMNEVSKAEEYIDTVFASPEFEEDPGIMIEAITCRAEIMIAKNDFSKAEILFTQALKMAKENEIHSSIQMNYEQLYKLNERKKNFESALMYHKAFTNLADSLSNKTQIKKFAELEGEIKQNQLKAEHDKKESDLRSEKIKKEEELKRQRTLSYSIGIAFVIMLFLSLFIYRSLRDNKKKTKIISEQKKEVEIQKEIIEEKKKEVMDSIAYAKKIQEAILPSEESIKKIFPESFVFYKPKDIVAGDFYWLSQYENTTLIAAADCTGHGVPGALVSVVCSNALNRAVMEFRLNDPGVILDKVREIVIETFEKSGSEVKDGMDISLMAIKNNDGRIEYVKWAGANNPFWYISNGQLIEIKGDKQPVGKFINNKPFTTQTVPLKKGDTVYLITDGFADQFGGPKGKKFKYRNLKELLIENSSQTLTYQNSSLAKNFDAWKSNLEQVDDVTILGVKI